MFTIALQSIFYPVYSTNEHWDSEGSYKLWLANSKITIWSQVSLILGSVLFLLGCALYQKWKCLNGDSCMSGGKKQYQGIIWSFHKKILSVFVFCFFHFLHFLFSFCNSEPLQKKWNRDLCSVFTELFTSTFIAHDLSGFRELMYFLLRHMNIMLGYWRNFLINKYVRL